jgi:hypothetical protein
MTRSRTAPPTPPRSANLSPAEIRIAIPLLEARIRDLEALLVETINSETDPRLLALTSAIDSTLAKIYGTDTHEYHRLSAGNDLCSISYGEALHLGSYRGGPPIYETHRIIERGRQRAIALLTTEVALMKEQLGDGGSSPTDRAIRAYSNLDLHPEIARAASALYQDHFPRFRASALFGRRPPERVAGSSPPASEKPAQCTGRAVPNAKLSDREGSRTGTHCLL